MLNKRIYTQKSTYCVIPHRQNYRDRKQITGHQGLRVGGGLTAKGHEGNISAMEQFYTLIAVTVTQLHAFVKTHKNVHQKG